MAIESDTEFTPELYPPFPTSSPGHKLPLATLETISLKAIAQDNDAAEQQRMLRACQSQGFFFLDLSGCEAGEVIRQGAYQIAQLAEKTFKLPVEEKLKYAYDAGLAFGFVALAIPKRRVR
jgi:isopenicillin N synthase-like dioxygenase